tara:strand:+ start:553 stop:1287 length:735 start_codon:yes stop_codon:yes gene_type:complete
MSKVVTTTVLPDVAGGSVTLGGASDSVVVTGNDIRTNALQDAGGNAVLTSNGSGTMSGMNSGFGGAMNLLSTQTGSTSSGIAFTTQLTSTYDVYLFKFLDIHPSANANFQFNGSIDGGSNYNVTKTTTWTRAEHYEDDASSTLAYAGGNDLAQSTSYQMIFQGMGVDNDDNGSGELWLFSPSGTTYAKHFYFTVQYKNPAAAGLTTHGFSGGYFNNTSAIDALNFNMASGTFDGTIKLYGISKS